MKNSEDLGKLILRVSLALLILLHGVSKLINGIDPIMGMVTRAGLPAAVAYLVYVGEVLAPLLLLAGVWSRLAALIIAGNMVVAVWLAHSKDLFTMAKSGGWALELQWMFFMVAIVIALIGAGRYSVAGSSGRWN